MRTALLALGGLLLIVLAWLGLSVAGVFARDITSTSWVLAASEHDGIVPPSGITHTRPSFTLDPLHLTFNDGCNSGTATAIFLGGRLRTANLSSTLAGCPGTTPLPVDVFANSPTLTMHDGWLELRDGDRRWAFEPSPRPPHLGQ